MRVVALDSALSSCSVAVWADGAVLARESAAAGDGATEALVPMLARAMDRARLGFGDVDRLAVTVGPGHFTSLRAGLAVARGLALAAARPLVGVTSLEAVAAGVDPAIRRTRHVLVALDSKRRESYLQAFDAQLSPVHDAVAMSAQDFAEQFGSGPAPVVAGDAAPAVACALARVGVAVEIVGPQRPDAAVVAALAAARAPAGGPVRPLYVHPPAVKLPASVPLT